MAHRRVSVASIVITILVAVTTVLLGTFGVINYTLEEDRRLRILRSELQGEADQLATDLALPIWNIDRDQIDKVIESSFTNRNIYAARVMAAGKVHAHVRDSLWRVVSVSSDIRTAGLLHEGRTVGFSGETIGSLTMYASTKFVDEELRGSLVQTIGIIIVLDLILTVSLYLLLRRVVLRPLQEVEHYAASVSSDSGADATVDSLHFRGELESLRLSIRKMVNMLEDRYRQLQEKVQQHRESEARYRDLVENTPDIIARFDREGRYLFVNSAIKQASTFRPEEFVGKTVWTAGFSSQQAEEREKLIRQVIETKLPVEAELVFDGVSGRQVYDWRAFPELDAKGDVQSVLAINRNITRRKGAEAALKESETRYRRLHESMTDCFAQVALTGEIVDANRSFIEMLGYPEEEILTLKYTDITPERWLAFEQKILETQVLPLGYSEVYEKEYIRKDGTVFPVELRTYLLRDTEGKPSGMWAIVRDITERKKAEHLVRESEKRFRAIFDHAPIAMAVLDMEGHPILSNLALSTMVGYSTEELSNMKFTDFTFPEDTDKDMNQFVDMIKGVISSYNMEKRYVHKNGSVVWANLLGTILRDENGTPQEIIGMAADITERKQAEEALNASMDQLHALAQRLQHVREEERKAMSHEVHDELGQVLTALRMDLMSLKGSPRRGELESKIESSLGLTDKAIEIVQDVSARLRPGVLDYLGLLAAMEWQTEEFQKRSGIRCSLALPDHDPLIDSDRATALFRILQEALTNVARHARAEKVQVCLVESADAYEMSIVDDGVGISQEQVRDPKSLGLLGMQERLFPFRGICTIQSGPRGGTEVLVRLPRQ